MTRPISLPYFDEILRRLAERDPAVGDAFGAHVHWGYWPSRRPSDLSAAAYRRATDALSHKHLELARIQPGQQVLDVGCGFGGTLALLNARRREIGLHGVNIDGRQLARAREIIAPRPGSTLALVVGDACALPYRDGQFDAVLAVECIFHFASRSRFFSEARRVLAPGGRLVVSDIVVSEPLAPVFSLAAPLFIRSLRRTFGDTVRAGLARQYRALAARTPVRLTELEDISPHIQPTFLYYREAFRHHEFPAHCRQAMLWLALMYRLGCLRYQLMCFRKDT